MTASLTSANTRPRPLGPRSRSPRSRPRTPGTGPPDPFQKDLWPLTCHAADGGSPTLGHRGSGSLVSPGWAVSPCRCAQLRPDAGQKGGAMAISSPPRRSEQATPGRRRTLVTALVLALIAALALATTAVVLLLRGGWPNSGMQGSGIEATQSRALARFSRLDL